MTTTLLSTYSAPCPTRMARLRQATAQAHARIEGVLPLVDPKLTQARYRVVLERLFGFYAAVAPLVILAAGAHAAEIELEQRSKIRLLRLDLLALGRPSVEVEALPRCVELPLLVTPSHAFGVLYVLEGATLGGQVIGRNLQAVLGLGKSNGAAFFAGYGDQTRAMWLRFSEYVDGSGALDTEAMIDSAVGTFETLRSWLVAVDDS